MDPLDMEHFRIATRFFRDASSRSVEYDDASEDDDSVAHLVW